MTDYSGNKPGDLFDTMDEAARDAAIYLGALSFGNCWEYATAIYTVSEVVVTFETVTKERHFLWWTWTEVSYKMVFKTVTKYTYAKPKTDKDPLHVSFPNAPSFKKRVAVLHTHPMGSGRGVTVFSDYYDENGNRAGDIAMAIKHRCILYVHGPNGKVRKYDPVTNEDVLLFSDLPISSKSPWLNS